MTDAVNQQTDSIFLELGFTVTVLTTLVLTGYVVCGGEIIWAAIVLAIVISFFMMKDGFRMI